MSEKVLVAVGVLVEMADGAARVLIARRPRQTVLGGYWELPGGKIESAESAEECLVREFEEELGLVVKIDRELEGSVEHRYDHGHVVIRAFYCSRVNGTPQNHAVDEHRWVNPHDLADYTFPPANDDLMRQIVAELSPRTSSGQ